MTDRRDLLPAALKNLPELPWPVVPDQNSFCTLHGPQIGHHCVQCDEAHGVNRAALLQADRIRALREELRALGINVGPIQAIGEVGDPAPNEAKQVQSVEERRAELQAQMDALTGQ